MASSPASLVGSLPTIQGLSAATRVCMYMHHFSLIKQIFSAPKKKYIYITNVDISSAHSYTLLLFYDINTLDECLKAL